MRVLSTLWLGIRMGWHRTPALHALIPFALGLYAGKCGATPWGMPLLLMSLVLMLLSGIAQHILRNKGILAPSLPWLQRANALAMALIILTLGMIRVDLDGAHVSSPKEISKVHNSELRLELIHSLDSAELSPDARRLMSAIALGYTERDADTKYMRELFAYSGAAHILAVSGYHLGVVVGVVALLLGRLRRYRYTQYLYNVMLIGVAWGFVALTDWGLPAQRAALMLTLYGVGRLLHRPPIWSNILAFSALLQLIIDPDGLYRWGMWLSYFAVLSIALYGGMFFHSVGTLIQPIIRWVWQALTISLSAQVMTMPLCLYFFGYISWSFLYTSIPLAFLSVLLIPLSLIIYFGTYCGLPMQILHPIAQWLSDAVLAIVAWGHSLTPLVWEAKPNFWVVALVLLLALVPGLYRLGCQAQMGFDRV